MKPVIVLLFFIVTQNFRDVVTPLMRAADAGRVNEVRRLLRNGADANEKMDDLGGLNALMLAARGGHLEVVKVLLKAGADPNASGAVAHVGFLSPLTLALNRKNKNRLQVFDTLIAAGARLNPPASFPESPLDTAIHANDIRLVRALLKRGSDVNWQSKFGKTPLVSAVTTGKRNVEIVALLLSVGADPNKPSVWDLDDCVSLLKWLDDQQRLSPDKVTGEMKRLIEQAGGRKYAKKSNSEPCKPWDPSRDLLPE